MGKGTLEKFGLMAIAKGVSGSGVSKARVTCHNLSARGWTFAERFRSASNETDNANW